MEKSIASNLNDFFSDSLCSSDRVNAMEFISDYFHCQEGFSDDGEYH